jgi:hypothetical protein
MNNLSKVLVFPITSSETDESEPGWKQAAVSQVVDGGHQFLASEVTGDAKKHKGAGPGNSVKTAIFNNP